MESLARKRPRLPCSGQQPLRGVNALEAGVGTGRWGVGPGAGPRSAGARGKFVCVHSLLQSLEAPSVHPEGCHSPASQGGAPCTPSLGKVRLGASTLPSLTVPCGVGSPGQVLGGRGVARPGCTGPPGPLAAGPGPLPSRRAGPRRGERGGRTDNHDLLSADGWERAV